MSNILPFTGRLPASEKRRKYKEEQKALIEKAGGEALSILLSWRKPIPTEHRTQMAKNMNVIIENYGVIPSKLDWQKDGFYRSVEDFRRDIHRMRLPIPATPGRRLIAHTMQWTHLLDLIQDYISTRGKSVSLEYLADKLTRGTRFHPTKNEQNKSDKLFYLLNGWSNELDEKHGLLATYKEIARARAEYFRLNHHGLNLDYEPLDTCNSERASDRLISPNDAFNKLFDMEFQDYTPDDWDSLFDVLPDDEAEKNHYTLSRDAVTDWKRTISPEGTLHFDETSACLWGGSEMKYLPCWFIGYHDYLDEKMLTETSKSVLTETMREHGTTDPMLLGHKIDWDLAASYLVLYPDPSFNRIIPYEYTFHEEGSDFSPLEQSYDLETTAYFFQPKGANEATVSRSLLVRIEESLKEIRGTWDLRAPRLESHPYLVWKTERESNIDGEIESMLERTGRIKPTVDGT